MKRETPVKGGLEQDAFTGWRKVLAYMSRPGRAKEAKHSYSRRDRRGTRQQVRRGDNE